ERSRMLEAAGEVDVAFGIYGDAEGAFAAGAPSPSGPEYLPLGGVLHEEGVEVPGAGEGELAERSGVPEAAAGVDVAPGVYGDAIPGVVVGPAAAPDPLELAFDGVLREEDVAATGADERGVAERGRVEEEPGGVDVAPGVRGEAKPLVVVESAAAPDPPEVAFGGVLREEHVPAAGADERGVAERSCFLEPPADVDPAVGADSEAVAYD